MSTPAPGAAPVVPPWPPTCGTCKFYDSAGLCRYNAPTFSMNYQSMGGSWQTMWPPVEANDWCGVWVQHP